MHLPRLTFMYLQIFSAKGLFDVPLKTFTIVSKLTQLRQKQKATDAGDFQKGLETLASAEHGARGKVMEVNSRMQNKSASIKGIRLLPITAE